MNKLKTVHRIIGIVTAVFLLYLSVTGLIIQSFDLRSIFAHAPLNDPDMMAVLESRSGGEYQVLSAVDYSAQTLPENADLNAMLQKVVQSARASLGNAPLHWIELRMTDGRLMGQVRTDEVLASFDASSGAMLHQGPPPPRETVSQESARRYQVKAIHRMTIFGTYALYINVIVGTALIGMLVTGVGIYYKLWRERQRNGQPRLLWVGGTRSLADWKRAMHRWIALAGAVFLLVVACSGLWLAYESLVFGFRMQMLFPQAENGTPNRPALNRPSPAQPLNDSQLPEMLRVTLDANRTQLDGAPIKVIRLRIFDGEPQGVVVTGSGVFTSQIAMNAATGRLLSEAEMSRPKSAIASFPFGWDAHQAAKAVHRGSYFGLGERFLDFFAGLALLYLCINGIALYIELWQERKQEGKAGFFWIGASNNLS